MSQTWQTILVATLGAALAGCAATQKHVEAETAYANGDFLDAADQYTSDARLAPLDATSAARLEDARTQALLTRLELAGSLRRRSAMPQAMTELKAVLHKRDEWKWRPPARVTTRIAEEVEQAGQYARAQVAAPLHAGDALVAERVYGELVPSLRAGDFAALRAEVEGDIRSTGQKRCSEHARGAASNMPYATFLASRYCAHFGADGPPGAVRPELASRLSVEGSIEGLTKRQLDELRAALESSFKSTPYFAASSPRAMGAHISGQHRVAFSAEAKTYEAPWIDTVTLPSVVTRKPDLVSVQPSPVGMAPMVIRNPGAVQVSGGGTVEVERMYSYVAIEHVGKYSSALGVRVDLGAGLPPAEIRADQSRTEMGRYHDVEFAPAKVHAERPVLRTADEFFALQVKLAQYKLVEGLKSHWQTSFCRFEAPDLEQAARCAIGSSEVDESVMKALEPEYAGDSREILRAVSEPVRAAADH
jgi:hypothetical protein